MRRAPLAICLLFLAAGLPATNTGSAEYASTGIPVWAGAPNCDDLEDARDKKCCAVTMQALAAHKEYRLTSWGIVVSLKDRAPPLCPAGIT